MHDGVLDIPGLDIDEVFIHIRELSCNRFCHVYYHILFIQVVINAIVE